MHSWRHRILECSRHTTYVIHTWRIQVYISMNKWSIHVDYGLKNPRDPKSSFGKAHAIYVMFSWTIQEYSRVYTWRVRVELRRILIEHWSYARPLSQCVFCRVRNWTLGLFAQGYSFKHTEFLWSSAVTRTVFFSFNSVRNLIPW